MASVRSLVLDGASTKQVQSTDTQIVASEIATLTGENLSLAPNGGTVSIAVDVDLTMAIGGGGKVDFSESTGDFTTTTGDITISGTSVTIDSSGAANTLSIGTNSDDITIGKIGKKVTFAGDVQVDGAQTVVGETTFQQDATFEGNTTFGNNSSPDTVTFSANTTVDLGANKITNLADPTAGSQEAATAKYVEDYVGSSTVASFQTSLSGLTPSTASTGAVTLAGTLGVTSGGTGTSTQFTQGSVVFAGASGVYSQNNTNLYWDDLNTKFFVAGKPTVDTHTFNLGVDGNSKPAFAIASGGRIHRYDGNDPANGEILIGDGVGKNFAKGSLTAGTNIAVTTGAGTLAIGLTGQVAIANGGTGQSTASAAFDALSPLTTKGDLLAYSTSNARLPVGTNGQILTADSAETLGVKWSTIQTGLTVGTTAISSGTANRILFEDASNVLQESANLTWDGSVLGVTGDTTVSANLKANGELWIDGKASLPSGAAGYGKLAMKDGDSAVYFVDPAGDAHYLMPDGLSDLGSIQGNVTVDVKAELPAYRSANVLGNLAFQSLQNPGAGRGVSLRVNNSSGATRTMTFPAGWNWLGGSAPVQIEDGKIGLLSLVCYGAQDSDVVAAWSYSGTVAISGSGTAGQIAFFDGAQTVTSESGLKWDSASDILNIGNAVNTAHSANLRVGGTAHISGEAWFDGSVTLGDASGDAITVNGAMSLASGASFDGASGSVTLPTQFSIGTGNAVSANVTAANLNTLTGGSDASSLHTHAGAGAVIVALNTAVNSLAAGDVVCADSAALQVKKADADTQATARVLGVVESAGKVTLAGLASAKFKSGLTVALGEPVYLSGDAGLLTNVAPNAGAIAEVGIIVDTADYAGQTKCLIALQVKTPIFLS